MNSHGFVFTLGVLLLVSFLFVYTQFYSGHLRKIEGDVSNMFAHAKVAGIADDLSGDLNALMGTGVWVSRSAGTARLALYDTFPSDVNKNRLGEWKTFAEGVYMQKANASVKVNVSRLLDGNAELMFSNGLQYVYAYENHGLKDTNATFFAPNGDTNFSRVDVNIFTNVDYNSYTPWDWNAGGDTNVSIYFRDGNASHTLSLSGLLYSGADNAFVFTFSGGSNDSLQIRFGKNGAALRAFQVLEGLDSNVAQARVSAAFAFPSTQSLSWWHDADLNVGFSDANMNGLAVQGSS